ncbi:hypothetical protein Lal_00013760 [Lupinus albus]|nr:hypothetical protein Lal_00013760 [Lupinus albus]
MTILSAVVLLFWCSVHVIKQIPRCAKFLKELKLKGNERINMRRNVFALIGKHVPHIPEKSKDLETFTISCIICNSHFENVKLDLGAVDSSHFENVKLEMCSSCIDDFLDIAVDSIVMVSECTNPIAEGIIQQSDLLFHKEGSGAVRSTGNLDLNHNQHQFQSHFTLLHFSAKNVGRHEEQEIL